MLEGGRAMPDSRGRQPIRINLKYLSAAARNRLGLKDFFFAIYALFVVKNQNLTAKSSKIAKNNAPR